jgi:DNA-binding transcriptional LysR family regulator
MAETQGRVTLWGIEVFLAVAEEGSISGAARRLGVSPSAVSQQVAGLEQALGAQLLDRTARPVRLTPAGAMFRRHAQTILNAEAEARTELAVADLSGLTTLRLGMIEDFDAEVTPALLTALSRDLKTCRFLLETGASHRLLDQLEARALDMVVAADLASGSADEGWREVHPLLAEPFVAITPKGHEIGDLPLIQYTARHLMGRQIARRIGLNWTATAPFWPWSRAETVGRS